MLEPINTDDVALDFSKGGEELDLVKMPLGAAVLRYGAIQIRDKALRAQFDKELNDLSGLIGDSVASERFGFLLKVEVHMDRLGTPSIPGGQIVLPIGVGREPVDAYAEFLNRDVISAQAGKGIETSTYVWVRRIKSKLVASSLENKNKAMFETGSAAEARRRRLLGDPDKTDSGGYQVVERANAWNEIARTHLDEVESVAEQAKIRALTDQMITAEKSFNEAYRTYQITAREAAEKAERMRILSVIDSVIEVVKTGIKVGAVCSDDGTPADAEGLPELDNATDQQDTSMSIKDLEEQIAKQVPKVNDAGQRLRDVEIEIRTNYEKNKAPIPYVRPLQSSDVTVPGPT